MSDQHCRDARELRRAGGVSPRAGRNADSLPIRVRELRSQPALFGVRRWHLGSDAQPRTDRRCSCLDRKAQFGVLRPRRTFGVDGGASLIPGQVDTAGQTFRTEDSFSAILPRFNILYRLSDKINAYATVSKGRRSDTVQLGAASTANGPVANFTPVAAENVWNYEIGLKDRRASFRARSAPIT